MKLAPVKGFDSLYRDVDTGAIVNINSQEADNARDRKRIRMLDKKHQEQINQRVVELSDDVTQMKEMLNQILEKI